MPFRLRKISARCYQVYNKRTEKVYSKCASKKNAEAQLRLLRAIEFNKSFVLRRNQPGRRKTRKARK